MLIQTIIRSSLSSKLKKHKYFLAILLENPCNRLNYVYVKIIYITLTILQLKFKVLIKNLSKISNTNIYEALEGWLSIHNPFVYKSKIKYNVWRTKLVSQSLKRKD